VIKAANEASYHRDPRSADARQQREHLGHTDHTGFPELERIETTVA